MGSRALGVELKPATSEAQLQSPNNPPIPRFVDAQPAPPFPENIDIVNPSGHMMITKLSKEVAPSSAKVPKQQERLAKC